MPPHKKNIVCIEGRWERDLTKLNSVAAGLQLLYENKVVAKQCCKQSHSAATTLSLLVEFTQKKYASFSIIYLSFHGSPNIIGFAKEAVTLEELQEKLANKLHGKILHFGSCQTLNVNKRVLTKFLKVTGARAISGFTKDIPFIESTLLDLLYFERCQYRKEMNHVEHDMSSHYSQLCKRLGFRLVTQEQ
ncbi:DUF6642 family protein [Hymenobacter baengnokdamensis]|uniref:DUF6642 family protein n=1 Tax=Hymenobacter baengnokdamensis TaxID=2615203 RepID=UPI0012477D30|nr:DUF6642 family protein [Hymenobacter baengnokdamensis]